MGAFGGPTPKRHMILCTDRTIIAALENRGGTLPKSKRQQLSGGPLVKKHWDKQGVLRTTGIKPKLKESQMLSRHCHIFMFFLTDVAERTSTGIILWVLNFPLIMLRFLKPQVFSTILPFVGKESFNYFGEGYKEPRFGWHWFIHV